jgi:LysM repeat protein
MDDDLDKAMEDFRQEIADAQGYRQSNEGTKDEYTARTKGPLNLLANRKNLIYGGIGVLVLILLIVLFSGSGDKSFKDDLLFIKAKFEQIEGSLKQIEGLEVKVAHLEKQQKELQQSIRDSVTSGKDLAEKMGSLSQTVETLKKGIGSIPDNKAKDLAAGQKKSASTTKKQFHEVRAGETLYRIAKTYGITLDELCRLNNISPNQAIQPGQKLLLAPSGNQ